MRHREWLVLAGDLAVCAACAVVPAYGVLALSARWQGITAPSLTALGIWPMIAALCVQNFAIATYVLFRAGSARSAYFGTQPDASNATLVWACLGIPLVLVANVLAGLLFVALGATHNQAASFPLTRDDLWGQWVFGLVAIVGVPVAEEFLFRGYLYGRVAGLAGPLTAAIASSLLFAVAHAGAAQSGSWVLVIQTGVLGAVLVWIRVRSQSLLPSIVAHIANNAVAILLVMSCVNNPERGCPAT